MIETFSSGPMVIYKISIIESPSRCYIGQTKNYERRMNAYRYFDCKAQVKIYRALKKYGVKAFSFEKLHEGISFEEANELEDYYIDKLDSINNGFNCIRGGRNDSTNWTCERKRVGATGRKHTESLRKLSDAKPYCSQSCKSYKTESVMSSAIE